MLPEPAVFPHLQTGCPGLPLAEPESSLNSGLDALFILDILSAICLENDYITHKLMAKFTMPLLLERRTC
jgi:hypothetical protein